MFEAAKFGVYSMFMPPLDASVNYAVTCEEIGLDAVAFTDQMVGNLPNEIWHENPAAAAWGRQNAFFDSSIVMALAADRTDDIELYFGAIDVVRHVPSKLAQHFLTLDHVAQGRAFFAVGASEAKNVLMYGHPRVGSAKKLEDSLAIIRKIFDSEGAPVWHEGERYSMKGGTVEIGPYGDRPPPVLAATGGTAEVLELVGRFSDGLLTNLPGMCHGGPEQFARDRQTIRDAAERAGRDPDQLKFAASVLVLMDDDPEQIQRMADTLALRWNTIVYGAVHGAEWKEFGYEHPLGDEWGYARHLVPDRMTAAEVHSAADAVPLDAVTGMGHFTGTADEVAAMVEPYFEAGLQYAFVVDHAALADPTRAGASSDNLGRLVEKVRGRGLGSAPLGYLGVADA